jgi:hypothetical protein
MDLLHAQQALNRSTAEHWDLFASHRERLTELLLGDPRLPSGRLCVLGAGNGNDLDLNTLAGTAAEIHLVDLDAEALELARARHDTVATKPLFLHAGVELTGVWPELEELPGAGAYQVQAVLERAALPTRTNLPGPFDVVVSACVLTQLMSAASKVLGENHPRFEELALALRAGHIRTMLDLTRRGGRALLVTELTSSDVLPEIRYAPDEALPALLLRAIATRQIFTAMSPAGLVSWIARERPAGARLVEPGIVGPWRWWLTRRRALLVIGMLLEPRH